METAVITASSLDITECMDAINPHGTYDFWVQYEYSGRREYRMIRVMKYNENGTGLKDEPPRYVWSVFPLDPGSHRGATGKTVTWPTTASNIFVRFPTVSARSNQELEDGLIEKYARGERMIKQWKFVGLFDQEGNPYILFENTAAPGGWPYNPEKLFGKLRKPKYIMRPGNKRWNLFMEEMRQQRVVVDHMLERVFQLPGKVFPSDQAALRAGYGYCATTGLSKAYFDSLDEAQNFAGDYSMKVVKL